MVATPRQIETYPSLGLDVTAPATATTKLQLRGLGQITRLEPGSWVGDYVISEVKSRGGFGTVYRAQHAPSATQVALKVLHGDLAVSPAMVRRFEREAAALNRIRHPNIVRVHDVGTLDDGRPFFAMEWLDGHTLDENIRMSGPFDLSEALPILEDLCACLRAAHDVGIIHRDLKASNVMLVPIGEWFAVKLFDFGIAKLLDPEESDAGMTSTGNRLGTPHHMAPEQIMGEPVDERTDIYALGVLLFQLLTGRFPFRGDNALEIEDMHLHTPPPHASEHAAVGDDIDALIRRCMAKHPDDRFPSMTALIEALRAAASADGDELESWARELRPSLRIRARKLRAVGIQVDLLADGDVPRADLGRVLAEIREDLDTHGFDVIEARSDGLFAAATLPEDGLAAATMRQQAIERALTLCYRLPGAVGARPVRVAFTVHAAPVLMLALRGRNDYVGGELLHLDRWAPEAPESGVSASVDALAGINRNFALQRRGGRLHRVIASVAD